VFPAPSQILDSIGLDVAQWDTVRAVNHDRVADGLDGQRATATDMIIALVRSGTSA